MLTFGSAAVILFVINIRGLFKKQQATIIQEKPEEKIEAKEVNIDVGEFGKIISDSKVPVNSVELNYFIFKKTNTKKTACLSAQQWSCLEKQNGRLM